MNQDARSRDRVITIVEALLLATVAVVAAWSGFAAAKWGTESRLDLSRSSAARTEASKADAVADTNRNNDSSAFDAWFTAHIAGDQAAADLAERRFRPEFGVAFDAWIATSPDTNPDSPPGPTYMSQYVQSEKLESGRLDATADQLYADGAVAAGHADDYVRITVYLAAVLFLVAISGRFQVRAARIALVVIGTGVLIFALVLLLGTPTPPV